MFESLTRYLPELEHIAAQGSWTIDRTYEGESGGPIYYSDPEYNPTVSDLEDAVYDFMDAHREFGIGFQKGPLERIGLGWASGGMFHVDVSQLDYQTVLALVIETVNVERICPGSILTSLETGAMMRWLTRLREIDEQDAAGS